MFRSVDMTYLQVLLPSAVAEEFADKMAREDIMQFTDLNEHLQPFQRKYTSDIIKIQEIERQVNAMEELLDSYEIHHDTKVNGNDLQSEIRPMDASQIIDSMSQEIGKSYKKFQEQSAVEKELNLQLEAQKNSIRVLQQIDTFLASENEAQILLQQQRDQKNAAIQLNKGSQSMGPDNLSQSLLGGVGNDHIELTAVNQKGDGNDVGFKYFAGIVTIAQRVSFERQIFLTSRGNSFVQFDDRQDDNVLDSDLDKIPFVVFFLGDQLRRSLSRLCQFMNIQICYESDDKRSREELLKESNDKRNDFYHIHTATANQLERDMKGISIKMKRWKIALFQEKAIRITLNKFSINNGRNNFLRSEGWCPTNKKLRISEILDIVTSNKGVGKPVIQDSSPNNSSSNIVPTHFELNEFTAPFQSIVNTYGIPRYKEFNPAVPTIITFPFLFAVMYGDIFHGSFLFLAAATLCISTSFFKLKNTKNENLKSFVDGRYVVLLMGFFAIYCGTIYNDAMSLMINTWNGSKWGYGYVQGTTSITLFQAQGTYAFGIDPVWHGLDNQLSFENSLKMKLSVIIGVTQMTFGLLLKLMNHIQEGDHISIWFEFIPQFIFMMSFFGYMVFLIIYKWCIDWRISSLPATPSLITVLIKMILGIGSITDEVQIFENAETQKNIQMILIGLMGISVPWMLIIKPLLLKRKHNREISMNSHLNNNNNDIERGYNEMNENQAEEEEPEEMKYDNNNEHPVVQKAADGGGGHGHGDEFDFSEIVIHQLIHTIEYVLGTISNTASYLRLWALSLAHAELSEVFYNQTIGSSSFGMNQEMSVAAVISNVGAQFVFLMATVGVLMVMDVLECFLHALRLHWVEFQNKFFYADGVEFRPFSYGAFLNEE